MHRRGLGLSVSARGFTLIELSLVLTILGILGVYALPKMLSTTSLSLGAQAELLAADLRRLQWMATTGNTSLCVFAATTQFSAHPYDSSCKLGAAITDPITLKAWVMTLSSSMTLTDTVSSVPLYFNSWGQPSRQGAFRLADLNATASILVQVEPVTGFITTVTPP